MKRILVLAFALCGFALSSQAQTTTVSGTITDTSSVVWKNGTYSFTFLPSPSNPTGNYFQNGVAFNRNQIITGSLDGTGSFAGVAVPDNLTIAAQGSQWTTQVCPAATATNGCYRINLTITGASQSITSAVMPPPILVNMQTGLFFAAYNDAEVTGARLGNSYFNLTDGTIHVCTIPVCTWVSVGQGNNVVFAGNTGNINATLPAVTMTTAPLAGGLYRLTFSITQTLLGAGCSGNSTYSVQAQYTDPNGSSVLQYQMPVTVSNGSYAQLYTVAANGSLGGANVGSGTVTFQAKPSTAAQYFVNVNPGSGCSTVPFVAVYVALEKLI